MTVDEPKITNAAGAIQPLLTELKDTIQHWQGAEVYYRKDWACEYFHVAGKYFCLYVHHPQHGWLMTVKGLPETNDLLREQYTFVIPGYYANKTHWNSIVLDKTTFSRETLLSMLKQSYDLVVASLPKKTQRNLAKEKR